MQTGHRRPVTVALHIDELLDKMFHPYDSAQYWCDGYRAEIREADRRWYLWHWADGCSFPMTFRWIYTVSGKKVPLYFLPFCQILTDLQNYFTVTLSSKFAIKKSLNIPPSFTHVATLPCKTVVLKNCKLHCRRILKTFNDNVQLHNKIINKIICSVNSHILASN